MMTRLPRRTPTAASLRPYVDAAATHAVAVLGAAFDAEQAAGMGLQKLTGAFPDCEITSCPREQVMTLLQDPEIDILLVNYGCPDERPYHRMRIDRMITAANARESA